MIRVFIVAASALARSSLEELLSHRDVRVVGSAENVSSLAEQLIDAEADVVLIDATGEEPAALVQALSSAEIAFEVPVIVLTDDNSANLSARAMRAGVRAVLPPDISREQIFGALQAAAAGLVVFHPQGLGEMLPAATPAADSLADLAEPLTRREREVLQMLASGLANKEIAARLNISDHTVKFHVASLLGKLGASSRTEAVALGIRRGLVLL